jgi:cytochrome b561
MPVTGWLVVSSGGRPVTSFLGLFDIAPLPVSRAEDAHDYWKKVHEVLAYTALALIALHLAGALKHHFGGHRHLIGRMAPWARRGEPRP